MCRKPIVLAVWMSLAWFGAPSVTLGQVHNLSLNGSFEEDEVILNDPAWVQWVTWSYDTGVSSTVAIDTNEFVDGTRSLQGSAKGRTPTGISR